jgi:hypothetical protein
MLLYHRIPPNMKGSKLIPLNEQRELLPELYKAAVQKYADRMSVMHQIIPYFECLWNDVLFLSPVHPQLMNDARRLYKVSTPETRWFEIDSDLLEQDKLLLYRHRPKWLVEMEPEKDEYEAFTKLTKEEKQSLIKLQEAGIWSIRKWREKALYWGHVPHILYRGHIDTTGLLTVVSTEVP